MALLRCDKCQTPLPGSAVNTHVPVACPACGVAMVAEVFPAFARPAARGRTSEALASAEDAGCFYHPHKKAVVPCDDCGRFLCALCDLELDGRHVCPTCVEAARVAGKSLRAGGQRTLHDQVALTVLFGGMAVGLITVGFATVITAPIALFLVIRYWNEPARSPVPRTRARLIVAGVLALLQIAGWSFVLYRYLYPANHLFL